MDNVASETTQAVESNVNEQVASQDNTNNVENQPGAETNEGVQAGDTPDTTKHNEGKTFSQEYVAQLRSEAAGYRVRLKELEALSEQLKAAKDRIAALEAEQAAASLEALRARVASEAGVPIELLPTSQSEEELREVAARLQQWAEGKKPRGVPPTSSVGATTGEMSKDDMARLILGV